MVKAFRKLALWKRLSLILFFLVLIAEIWFRYRVHYSESKFPQSLTSYNIISQKQGKVCQDSWLRKHPSGLFELYVQGNAIERGLKTGVLLKDLLEYQEDIFVHEFDHFIPSWFLQKLIQRMISWFNRDMEKAIPLEYLEEIYGISRQAPDKHNRVGPAYQRMVNYHGAHDIGHALQNLNLVGCTSFGLWDNRTHNQDILLGRNFDFYVNDAFAENKIVCMMKPEKGFGMVFVTWAGFIGVVSGMNEKGLSLTLNAAPSEIPYHSATPVSLVAREVLQYAETIEQAYKIIQKRQVFVSETFMIGSLADNKVVIIEKTPQRTEIYTQSNQILCTNHFQSEALKHTALNEKQLQENPSNYRLKRLQELLAKKEKLGISDVVSILRDTKGINEEDLGYCNEGAINQLIAHHSVLFSLQNKTMYVSANPWACGSYVQYNLDSIFRKTPPLVESNVGDSTQNIPADDFLKTEDYQKIIFFKRILANIRNTLGQVDLSQDEQKFIESNPNYFGTYFTLAKYAYDRQNYTQALHYLEQGFSKKIPSGYDFKKMQELKQKIAKKMK